MLTASIHASESKRGELTIAGCDPICPNELAFANFTDPSTNNLNDKWRIWHGKVEMKSVGSGLNVIGCTDSEPERTPMGIKLKIAHLDDRDTVYGPKDLAKKLPSAGALFDCFPCGRPGTDSLGR